MNALKALNIDDLRLMAKACLPRMVFDYAEGGAEDELCLRTNRAAFERRHLVPRYFVDVTKRDQSIDLFGHRYDSPFGIAPMGSTGLFRPGADLMLAEAAAKANIPFLMSTISTATLEEAAKIAPKQLWFQLYPSRDPAIYTDMIKRAAAAGIYTLVVTADTPVSSKRERDFRNGFALPRRISIAMIVDAMIRPGWTWRYLRSGGMPMFANWIPYAKPHATAMDVAKLVKSQIPRPLSWQDLEAIRKLWPGRLVAKGLMHPDDVMKAKQIGCEGVIVSNHGGRQLDRAIASIDVLEAIKAAAGDDLVVMLDSGVRRGADILVALALGARFVFSGRAALYGASVGGTEGASRAIAILRNEFDIAMGQIGCVQASMLNREFIHERTG